MSKTFEQRVNEQLVKKSLKALRTYPVALIDMAVSKVQKVFVDSVNDDAADLKEATISLLESTAAALRSGDVEFEFVTDDSGALTGATKYEITADTAAGIVPEIIRERSLDNRASAAASRMTNG